MNVGRAQSFAAIAVISTCATCTHAPWKPHEGWSVTRVGHVAFYTDTLFEHRRELAWMQVAEVSLGGSFFRGVDPGAIEVVYFQRQPGFLDRCSRLRTAHNAGHGIVPLGVNNNSCVGTRRLHQQTAVESEADLTAMQGRNFGRPERAGYEPYCTGDCGYAEEITHQLAHQFLAASAPRAPAWFHEGVAQYLEHMNVVPQARGRWRACFGQHQPALNPYKVTIPTSQIFSASWQDYDRSLGGWFEFTAWATIDYLLHGDNGALRARFPAFTAKLARGASTPEAFTAIYPEVSLATLDQKVQAHVRTVRPPLDVCPLGYVLDVRPPGPQDPQPAHEPVATETMSALFDRLQRMPRADGYADWLPADIAIATAH